MVLGASSYLVCNMYESANVHKMIVSNIEARILINKVMQNLKKKVKKRQTKYKTNK